MNKITSFKQIKAIIEPIPAEKFIIGRFGDGKGNCCFLGHIHVALSESKDSTNNNYNGDSCGYGARDLTKKFFEEVHPKVKEYHMTPNGASVNNSPTINGYTETVIKDRLMHMIEDGIKWEESKL